MLMLWVRVLTIRLQSDIVNTKVSVLTVCNKLNHTNKRKVTE